MAAAGALCVNLVRDEGKLEDARAMVRLGLFGVEPVPHRLADLAPQAMST